MNIGINDKICVVIVLISVIVFGWGSFLIFEVFVLVELYDVDLFNIFSGVWGYLIIDCMIMLYILLLL